MRTYSLCQRAFVFFCFLLLGYVPVRAQPVNVDLNMGLSDEGKFTTALPFDKTFTIKGRMTTKVERVYVWFREKNGLDCQAIYKKDDLFGVWTRNEDHVLAKSGPQEFALTGNKELTPDVKYLFCFNLSTTTDDPDYGIMRPLIEVVGAAPSSFVHHVHQDFGFVWAPKADYFGAASTLHFYAVPVNKMALPQGLELEKRISLFVGIVFQKLFAPGSDIFHPSRDDKPVENLLSIGSPVVGIGIRPGFGSTGRYIWQKVVGFRLNFGLVFFNQTDANPLVNEKRLKAAYTINVTYDIELQKLLKPLTGLFK